MPEADVVVTLNNVGRMYKLYERQSSQLWDMLGLSRLAHLKFREFWAVRNVNLAVRRGERIGLVGRNGAGKSTLLKLICSRIQPSEGSVHVCGELQALLTIGAGFHNELTGRDNIKVALTLQGMSLHEIRRYEEEIIDFAELEEFIDQPVKFFSAGMYTRLAFAVATTIKPDVLVIDEVLGAGDAAFTAKCADRMQRLTKESGATVLYVSHALESIIQLCDRAVLVESGQIVADSDPLSIVKIYNHKIRQEEELAIRSREFRVRKRDLRQVLSTGDLQHIMFSIRCGTLHPKAKHKLRSAAILSHGEEVTRLDFGAPMDNAESSANRILDAAGLMDWGTADRDQYGFFRRYEDRNGKYAHAPFIISVPVHLRLDSLTLALETDIAAGDQVSVHQLIGEQFAPLATLPIGPSRLTLPLTGSAATEPETEPAAAVVTAFEVDGSVEVFRDQVEAAGSINQPLDNQNQSAQTFESFVRSHSVYGSCEVVVQAVDLIGPKGVSKRVFEVGERMTIQLDIESEQTINNFVACVCIYFRDTRAASQVYCPSERLALDGFTGRARIEVDYDPLRLGAGEYMISIGLFKSYNLATAVENEAYCVVDRAIMFKVHQPAEVAKSLGNFAHPVCWRSGNLDCGYDPAAEH